MQEWEWGLALRRHGLRPDAGAPHGHLHILRHQTVRAVPTAFSPQEHPGVDQGLGVVVRAVYRCAVLQYQDAAAAEALSLGVGVGVIVGSLHRPVRGKENATLKG